MQMYTMSPRGLFTRKSDRKNMAKLIPYKDTYIMPEWKCYTIWFTERYNVIKGKTLKREEIDPDLLMCLEIRRKIEEAPRGFVHIIEGIDGD